MFFAWTKFVDHASIKNLQLQFSHEVVNFKIKGQINYSINPMKNNDAMVSNNSHNTIVLIDNHANQLTFGSLDHFICNAFIPFQYVAIKVVTKNRSQVL